MPVGTSFLTGSDSNLFLSRRHEYASRGRDANSSRRAGGRGICGAERNRALLVRGAALVTAALLVVPSSGAFLSMMSPSTTNSPIQHVVFLVQENRAFDNYFGVYPGVSPPYALDLATCIPTNLANPTGPCVGPINLDDNVSLVNKIDLSHDPPAATMSFDNGKMDGFYAAQYKYYCGPNALFLNPKCLNNVAQIAKLTMEYYTNATVPDYWDLASYYSLDANFHSSMMGASLPNHLYTVAGQAGTVQYNNYNFDKLTFNNIANVMTQYGVAWKYYSAGWSDTLDCTALTQTKAQSLATQTGYNAFWSPLQYFNTTPLNPTTCHNQQNLDDFFNDAYAGNLPQVSWIVGNVSYTEHTGSASGPTGIVKGQEYTASVIDAISSNPTLWSNTAIFLTWDDWGGFYDSIPPQSGYGFRVPLVVISPFSQQGMIFYGPNGQQEEFSAFLSTIEQNWNLPSLTSRDASEPSLFYMLNFTQAPLAPLILPTAGLATYPLSSCTVCAYGSSTMSPTHYGLPQSDGQKFANLTYDDTD